MVKRILLIAAFMAISGGLLQAQTFSGTGGDIPDDGTTNSFSQPVSGLPNAINSVNFGIERVCFSAVHPWVADLNISLRAPNGTLISLVSGVGGDTDGFVNTCMSNDASTSIFEVWYPFTGNFRPFGDLGQVNNGQDPNGVWELVIFDTYAFADAGSLQNWSITFGDQPALPFVFDSSDLPILKINTGGQSIVNEPKIDAQFQLIDNGPGQRNYTNQTNFAYTGTIGIEQRGNSSQGMPKKSYSFEFRDEEGEDKDVTLLQLPAGSDFVLAANFSDKTLMRNALSYETFRQMGHYATRTRFCELILNNTYVGVYILTEDIRRDKDRVDISKLKASDTSGVDLTGGYMLRIDWNRTPGWVSPFSQPNSPSIFTYFQHTYPRWNELHPKQEQYIRSYVDSFEQALHGHDFQDLEMGWRAFGQENTFIDYLILNELSKNVDGYRLSTYFFKDRADKGGKLRMGPPWDYDLAWYNADYCAGFDTEGFAFDINYVCGDAGVPFWWEKLMADTLFTQNLACRWQQLRQTSLAETTFLGVVDSMANVLNEAQVRNFTKWPILGTYVWPNPGPLPSTYSGEVDKMKNWIEQRMAWLDETFLANLPALDAQFSTSALGGLVWQFEAPEWPGYTYTWDFGDGTTAQGANVVHEFAQTGTYSVHLDISTPFGCSAADSRTVLANGVGVVESAASAGISFFPNPVRGQLQVVLPDSFAGKFTLQMHNALGELVLQKQYNAAEKQLKLSVGHLPAGLYAVGLQAENRRVSTTLMIQR